MSDQDYSFLQLIKEILKNNDNISNNDNETYSLRIITIFLKSKNIHFEYKNSRVHNGNYMIYNHGILVTLPISSGNRLLSIQTHPIVAGPSFAETLLLDDMTSDKRHKTPELLFEYINELLYTEKL